MEDLFEIAAGSVVGRVHVQASKPNQDAFARRSSPAGLVGVVCDGCGSGSRSEIGASLGARLIVEAAMSAVEEGADVTEAATWERVRARTLGALSQLLRAMSSERARSATITEHLLFTALGLVITGEKAVVFGVGDGIFAVNGDVVRLGPFPGNAPPYLAYGIEREGPRFTIHRALAAEDVSSILIGTDGAVDYDALAGSPRPGAGGELVPPLRSFWEKDQYYRNEDALRRSLYLLNREVTRPLWAERRIHKEPGLLEDDTTILVARRRRGPARFGDPLPGLTRAQMYAFTKGLDEFTNEETPETGLGPIFNDVSCVACHSAPAPGGSSWRTVCNA